MMAESLNHSSFALTEPDMWLSRMRVFPAEGTQTTGTDPVALRRYDA